MMAIPTTRVNPPPTVLDPAHLAAALAPHLTKHPQSSDDGLTLVIAADADADPESAGAA